MPPDGLLCVALDEEDAERCLWVARLVAPHCAVLKIGPAAFASGGPALVGEVARLKPVFLDLKLHDIPLQVERSARAIADLEVAWTTVHASGGADMVAAAVAGSGGRTGVLAVTVLTSLDDDALRKVGVDSGAEVQVDRLAALALDCGADGLVCSGREVGALRGRYGPASDGGPVLIVPGIRAGDSADDQRRTLSARAATAAGADLVVVGRPITSASDPAEAARSVAEEIRA
jgi:orotidine-5'-phosphate decarboxylase